MSVRASVTSRDKHDAAAATTPRDEDKDKEHGGHDSHNELLRIMSEAKMTNGIALFDCVGELTYSCFVKIKGGRRLTRNAKKDGTNHIRLDFHIRLDKIEAVH
jgi:hypothetical protein